MTTIQKKNYIHNIIKDLETTMSQNQKKYDRLIENDSSIDPQWVKKQINKIDIVISICTDDIKRYQSYLHTLNSGHTSSEFDLEYNAAYPLEKQKKKENVVKDKSVNSTPVNTNNWKGNRRYNFKREYFYYKSLESRTPDYIMKNLKTMPNNKGYIYNGIWFFGERNPTREEKIIMFEKNRKKFFIHELTSYSHKVILRENKHKSNKQSMTVVSETPRRKI